MAVTAGGICGSDLHLFAHTGPSPTLMTMGSSPFVLDPQIPEPPRAITPSAPTVPGPRRRRLATSTAGW
ncbi:MAG TPA: hypothetical protein VNC61_04895 [Acidimicrobiales bacterium]|nr:hypothetical protein [Acidimicrobiales bacterium]